MEIKRRLGALAKRMTPAIEVMNVSNEMLTLLRRLEELCTYAQTKIDRSEERKAKKQLTRGAEQDAKKKAKAKEIAEIHAAEADERFQDQVQHKAQAESITDPVPTKEPITEESLEKPAVMKKTAKKKKGKAAAPKGEGVYFKDEPD